MPLLTLEGQEVGFNPERKIIRLELKEPFMKAGKILNWNPSFGTVGVGINKSIIKLVHDHHAHLIVRIDSFEKTDYWLNYDKLVDFIKNNNNEYMVGKSKFIHVVPWAICTRYQSKSEAN